MIYYDLSPQYIFFKKEKSISVTSVDPTDNEVLDFKEVSIDMFIALVELKLSTTEVEQKICETHDVELGLVQKDLDRLIQFLLEKKVIILRPSST
jgi:hypothetical protein